MSALPGGREAAIALLVVVAALILYHHAPTENFSLGSSTMTTLKGFLSRGFGGAFRSIKNQSDLADELVKVGKGAPKQDEQLLLAVGRLDSAAVDEAKQDASKLSKAVSQAGDDGYPHWVADFDEVKTTEALQQGAAAEAQAVSKKFSGTYWLRAAEQHADAAKSPAAKQSGVEETSKAVGEGIKKGSGGELDEFGYPKDKVKKWDAIKTAVRWTAAGIGTAATSLFLYEEIKSLVTGDDGGGGEGGDDTAGGTVMASLMASGVAAAMVCCSVVVCLVVVMVAMKKKGGGGNSAN